MSVSQPKSFVYLATPDTGHVSDYTVRALERSLSRLGVPGIAAQPHRSMVFVSRALARLGLLRSLFRVPQPVFFAPLMGPAEFRLFPVCYAYETIVYCYDCWPYQYGRWEALFKRQRTRIAFFSARQSARYFASRIPAMKALWLAEAMDPADYVGDKPLAERTIDVLELGRRHDHYHSFIERYLQETNRVHLFENPQGQIVFPTRSDLLQGFGNTKISVCFPSSMTHPERSGNVETVTHRYFESMASKCLVLGHCPDELRDLFGYNPVIEVDFDDPRGQLDDLLVNLDMYEHHIARNFDRLLEVGTWDVRAREMLSLLRSQGYAPRSR